jgi:hypothetical protein
MAAASLGVLAAPAAAETYAGSAIEVRHAAAVLDVVTEDRANVDVTVTAGARIAAPTVRVENNKIVIDGDLRGRLHGCSSGLNGVRVRVARLGNVRREDLPRITIRAPRTLDLSIGGAVFSNVGASRGGEITAAGCGDTEIGDANGPLDLTLAGSGDMTAGEVSGALTATLAGSGSLRVGGADGGAVLRLNGSGDLNGGDITGALDARLAGSGSLRAGTVEGDTRLMLNGSGDLVTGPVRGALSADLNGSGSLSVASVMGDSVALNLSSSGDVLVRAGATQQLTARNSGSGSVRFAGHARVSHLTLSSSGDISVSDAGRVEHMTDSGSGSIELGH